MTEFNTTTPPPYATPQRSGMRFKHLLLLVLLSFLGGAAVLAWLANSYGYLDWEDRAVATAPLPAAPAASGNVQPSYMPPVTTQVDALQDRLSQINQDAAASAGNAARAEALLTAFAARRALDGGKPLGYIADQLQQRFGAAQPQAVATILTAAQTPVTLDSLSAELGALETVLTTGAGSEDLWGRIQREASELFVLRRDGSPSPAPSSRFRRATIYVESGNVAGAIALVRQLPGAASAAQWLARAQNYDNVRKALDVIERASLVSGGVSTPVAPAPQPIPQAQSQTTPQALPQAATP